MKTFTLELSREAMLFLQCKLPKGYTLIKTVGQNKKKSKSIKNVELSLSDSFHDAPSRELEPAVKKGQPNAKKAPNRLKEVARTKQVRNEPEPQIKSKNIKNQTSLSKKSQKKPKKSKEVPQCDIQEPIFNSEDEDTSSEPKNETKTKLKQEKIKQKTQKIDSTKKQQIFAQSPTAHLDKNDKEDHHLQKENSDSSKNNEGLVSKEISPKNDIQSKTKGNLPVNNHSPTNEQTNQQEGKKDENQQKNVFKEWQDIGKKNSKKKVKPKKYSYEDRLDIISRIRGFDRKTMSEFFKAINFSRGESLDFKVMEDSKIEPIEIELIKFEKILKERLEQEKKRMQIVNPKSMDDFEMADDEDYEN